MTNYGLRIVSTVALLLVPFVVEGITAQSISSGPTTSLPLATSVPLPPVAEINTLEADLKKKRDALEVLQKQIQIYEKTVTVKQNERLTLQRELSFIEQRLTATGLRIQATKQQLDILAVDVRKVKKQLELLQAEEEQARARLRVILELIREEGDRNPLELFLTAESFSAMYDTIATGEQLSRSMVGVLEKLKDVRAQATARQDELEAREREQRVSQQTLLNQKAQLESDRTVKDLIVAKTQESEKKFQQFLESARYEEEQANADIIRIEKDIRAKLEAQPETHGRLGAGESGPMNWPVSYQGIVATFHDPTYIFRNIFEHPAIDMRTLRNGTPSNGLEIRAAASGYVGRVRDGGMGYSYIMILHSDRLSTVYGHVSKIVVQSEQYVTQGQVIGLSGGLPGTPGAGRLTTGPHLHFEVRLDGIPVNPLNYLPSL